MISTKLERGDNELKVESCYLYSLEAENFDEIFNGIGFKTSAIALQMNDTIPHIKIKGVISIPQKNSQMKNGVLQTIVRSELS